MTAYADTSDRALRSYRADLHIHTALSPCAADETYTRVMGFGSRGSDIDPSRGPAK